MPAQCPGCNHFASLETQDPEVNSLDIDETGRVTGEIRLARSSACCGEEMKEATFDIDIDPPDDLAEHIHDHEEAKEEFTLSVDENEAEVTEELETTDRKGKPIKSVRYMKTRIGFKATFSVSCDCGWDTTVEAEDFTYASAFEEI